MNRYLPSLTFLTTCRLKYGSRNFSFPLPLHFLPLSTLKPVKSAIPIFVLTLCIAQRLFSFRGLKRLRVFGVMLRKNHLTTIRLFFRYNLCLPARTTLQLSAVCRMTGFDLSGNAPSVFFSLSSDRLLRLRTCSALPAFRFPEKPCAVLARRSRSVTLEPFLPSVQKNFRSFVRSTPPFWRISLFVAILYHVFLICQYLF